MSRMKRAVVLAALGLCVLPGVAAAHQGNPNYRSVLRAVTPTVPGLKVQVLGYDSQMQLVNRSGRPVTIFGYQDEPYARVLADGTVQVNLRSPAYYLNEDVAGDTPVPASANPEAAPQWHMVDRTGKFVWHDHRMHWMAKGLPSQVHDKSVKTKIFDYQIPMSVGSKPGRVAGTLFWVGSPGGLPVGAIVALVIAVVLAVGLVVVVRSRRRERPPKAAPAQEAW
jgi:hypothetical protein